MSAKRDRQPRLELDSLLPAAGRQHGRTVSIDWFEASVKNMHEDDAFRVLVHHFGTVFGKANAEILRCDERGFTARGAFGFRMQVDRIGQADRDGHKSPWLSIRLPGELCRTLGTGKVLDLAHAMAATPGFKVSRIDLALDDFYKTFSPRTFAEACVAGALDDERAILGPRAITRVRPGSWDWSRRKGGCFRVGLGASARMVRVYDKDQESSGLIPSTRIELQSRDEFATTMTLRLLDARKKGAAIAGLFFAHLVEFIDLREPIGDRSSCHTWPRVPFWADLVGNVKGISTPPPADSEVDAWVRTLSKQAAGFLTVMLRAHGVGPREYAATDLHPDAALRVVAAMRVILGRRLPELSAEHQIRLEQLQRETGRRLLAKRARLADH